MPHKPSQNADYRIADMRIRLDGVSPGTHSGVHGRLAAFRVNTGGTPHLRLKVHVGRRWHPPDAPRLIYHAAPHWSILRAGGLTVYQVRYARPAPTEASGHATVVVDWSRGSGEAYLPDCIAGKESAPEIETALLGYPLGEVLLITHLADHGGLLLHACGIECDGECFAFLGNSGHGKSTLARLCDGNAHVLNDDRVVVRRHENHFRVYGTPWHGDYAAVSASGGRMRGLFVLYRGRGPKAGSLTSATSICLIMQRSFPPFWSAQGMQTALEFCSDLVSAVPCKPLVFAPSDNIRDLIACAA